MGVGCGRVSGQEQRNSLDRERMVWVRVIVFDSGTILGVDILL